MLRLFRFKRRNEIWVDYCARTCKTARKIWIQGEPRDGSVTKDPVRCRHPGERPSSGGGGNPCKQERLKEDPCDHTRWKDKWRWHNRGGVWAGKKIG